jgi:hypothetical protein
MYYYCTVAWIFARQIAIDCDYGYTYSVYIHVLVYIRSLLLYRSESIYTQFIHSSEARRVRDDPALEILERVIVTLYISVYP